MVLVLRRHGFDSRYIHVIDFFFFPHWIEGGGLVNVVHIVMFFGFSVVFLAGDCSDRLLSFACQFGHLELFGLLAVRVHLGITPDPTAPPNVPFFLDVHYFSFMCNYEAVRFGFLNVLSVL